MSTDPATFLAHATRFEWPWIDPEAPWEETTVTLELRSRQDDPQAQWAICNRGSNLNNKGIWEYEPMPSSRTPEFFARCRWPSAQEALAFVEAHLTDWRTTGPLPGVARMEEIRAEMIARRNAKP